MVETHKWRPPVFTRWEGGGLSNKTMACTNSSVQEKAATHGPVPSQTTQFPTMCPCRFSSCCPSAGAQLVIPLVGKSTRGLFKRSTCECSRTQSQSQCLLVFTSNIYGNFSPQHWIPVLGWGWDLAPLEGEEVPAQPK